MPAGSILASTAPSAQPKSGAAKPSDAKLKFANLQIAIGPPVPEFDRINITRIKTTANL
jgi:hypothetical protein